MNPFEESRLDTDRSERARQLRRLRLEDELATTAASERSVMNHLSVVRVGALMSHLRLLVAWSTTRGERVLGRAVRAVRPGNRRLDAPQTTLPSVAPVTTPATPRTSG
jgi:hypothetical protein